MFTHKDIQNRSLFIVNGTDHQNIRVSAGRLMLFNTDTEKTITVLPFPKIMALLIIGHTTITTSAIEHCNKHGVPMVVMKPNFRPVFYFGNMAEANFLLRKKQYLADGFRLDMAQKLIQNKCENQLLLLNKLKKNNTQIIESKEIITRNLPKIPSTKQIRELMGIEGLIANYFFKGYFNEFEWDKRIPRVKPDYINSALDTGYTMLFNYIECMTRLFGFDPYMGVYHQLWFRRKSLVCDLMEPFRCIIDHRLRNSLKSGVFKSDDFAVVNGSYYLIPAHRKVYTKAFFEAIIIHKTAIFKYVQTYYRYFMNRKTVNFFPVFNFE